MKEIILEDKYIKEYIGDILNGLIIGKEEVKNAKYHHNTKYELAPSLIKHGILSLEDINQRGIKKYSHDFLNLMADTDSHINGNKCVSLSVVGLNDLYPDEEEYNPYNEDRVDFLIDSDIKTYRMTIHYGNEYVSRSLEPDKIKSVDIRLLKYIELLNKNEKDLFNNDSAKKLIEKYNNLMDIALALKQSNLGIPIREMSNNENLSLDIDRLSDSPKILLKK